MAVTSLSEWSMSISLNARGAFTPRSIALRMTRLLRTYAHHMPPRRSALRAPDYQPSRGSYCANGRSQTKSPAEAGPVQAEEQQAYLIRAIRNMTARPAVVDANTATWAMGFQR
jgi:hypothetical protein